MKYEWGQVNHIKIVSEDVNIQLKWRKTTEDVK